MSKYCEVCGRSIKTGRKYCWQHRFSEPIKKINQEESSLDLIEYDYSERKIKDSEGINFFIGVGSFLIMGVIGYLIGYSFWGFLLGLLGWFVIPKILNGISRDKIEKEIKTKNPKFAKFAKEQAEEIKKEGTLKEKREEFAKSLFR